MQDIYNISRILENEKRLTKEKLPKEESEAIFEYLKHLQVVRNTSKSRQIKILTNLRIFRLRFLKKPYERATKDELMNAVCDVRNYDYAAWTRTTMLGVIKHYYKYLEWGIAGINKKQSPEKVAWINTTIKKKEKPKISQDEILTVEEVHKPG